jgi:hypothetical protein
MVFNSKSGVGWIADGVDWVGYRHWPSYKILRKRTLKRLKRKAQGDCSLETTMAYLSHAKASASLEHVSNIFWRDAPEHRVAVHDWLLRHSPRYRMCSASHR